jgi:hypothetical protein
MADRESFLLEETERAKSRLQHEANQYGAMAEPLVVIQYLLFRSFIQEAHVYALLDQLSTGKMELLELQKRFIDHANRIATELQIKSAGSRLVKPSKRGN